MPIHSSVLALVGETPIIRAQHLDAGPCTIYLKLESQNPGGSIKDDESIAAANDHGIAMAFTGVRIS